ncbi:hypothetical protein CDD83_1678 [Cordyceps sp. RAO-2017]|nr:hypothetical protein CDD83_1678 [Cordyceps sp. RAO-2017]
MLMLCNPSPNTAGGLRRRSRDVVTHVCCDGIVVTGDYTHIQMCLGGPTDEADGCTLEAGPSPRKPPSIRSRASCVLDQGPALAHPRTHRLGIDAVAPAAGLQPLPLCHLAVIVFGDEQMHVHCELEVREQPGHAPELARVLERSGPPAARPGAHQARRV